MWWYILVANGALGVGLGLVFSSMSAIIVSPVPTTQTGAATGMNANIRTIGGAVGTAIAGTILTSGTTVAHRFSEYAGYTKIFWFLAAAPLAATIAAVLIPAVNIDRGAVIDSVVLHRDRVGFGCVGRRRIRRVRSWR